MMRTLTPDIAEVEVEAIEKVISVPQVELAVSALTMDAVADSPLPPMTRIGIDAAIGADVMVGDRERCGGFYILGQPRTGKSNLLISMALSDIEKGTSILFIDPHTDAITDLLSRIPQERRKNVILLDPTEKGRSFGINLLHCADRTDPLALDETWGRMRDVFVKVWGDEKGQLGFWFDKILRNSVYLLLENPEYTLVEVPLLLREDTTFRNSLIEKVMVKPSVRDFWFDEFDRLSRRDKTEQVGPALNRLSVFRDIHIIRDIVGQTQSNLDFRELLQGKTQRIILLRMPANLASDVKHLIGTMLLSEVVHCDIHIIRDIVGQARSNLDFHELLQGKTQRIILLRMPANLASDVKHLIGTMLLSEVAHAAFERANLPEKDRPYFGIYCDEFQEFATPDFARLFTQTGKFKVMPTVAHQTRFGQFRMEDPNRGATLASRNKVFFTLSSADAKEVPLEFARSPTETGVVSQYPLLYVICSIRRAGRRAGFVK
jgi:hypothetical protein